MAGAVLFIIGIAVGLIEYFLIDWELGLGTIICSVCLIVPTIIVALVLDELY